MRQLHRFIFLVIITILIIVFFFFLKPNEFYPDVNINKSERYLVHDQSVDNFTRCLLDMDEALNALSIPWFLAHGSALMYWRSKNFISDDMDIAVFYEDLQTSIPNETEFLKIMKNKYHFQLSHGYGQIDHGKEWTFSCPRSPINIDIFVFYRYNETKFPFAYWTASYNGLCNDMIYKKCRWGFSDFNLTTFEMSGKNFSIVPLEFIIERYGKDYMIPKKYHYFESLKILPNLIPEYDYNRTKNDTSQKKPNKQSSKPQKKGIRWSVF